MKKIYFIVPAVAALASCSKLNLTSDNFTVTPTPLEYVAGEVPANISANIPAKAMPKKVTVTCTPVLKYNGGEAVGTSATFQGEKVEGNNTIISYSNGGNATMRTSFLYKPEMAQSDLYMRFDAKKGDKAMKLKNNEVKIGYGVLGTAALLMETAKSANNGIAPDHFQRIISQKQEAAIKFIINQANLRGSELNSQNIQDFIKKLKDIKNDSESLALKNIEINAYASPDGKYDYNEKLADKRGQNSEGYVKQQLKKTQLEANVDTKYTAEDWEGFQELVKQSNLQDKDVILNVLKMYQDPEQREQEIKNISVVYKDLATAILPELRRARMAINYDVIGRSDEQILAQFASDASKLSVEELLYAANRLAKSDSQKEQILKKTTELFPRDYRAYNNLGEVAMRQGNIDAAKSNLNKALQLNASAPEPNSNLGLIALQAGDFAGAEGKIAKAVGANNNDDALGNLYIAQGKYTQAAAKLAGSVTNSAALAQILAKNYSDAKSTLGKIKNADATTYYLQAILAARQNDSSTVRSALAKAIQMNPAYAAKAKADLEFNNYADIVKTL